MLLFISGFFLLIGVADFFLANFLFYQEGDAVLNRLAAGRGLMLGIFCLFSAFFYASTSNENAAFWNQVRAIPLILLPAFTAHFTWKWTLYTVNKYSWALTAVLYISAAAFIIADFFTNILGLPARDPVYTWVTITTNESVWPFLLSAWAILLAAGSIVLASFYYLGITNLEERKRHRLVLAGLALPALPTIVIGLLPVAGLPDLLAHLPVWLFISDLLIAVGLTSRHFFSFNFSSAFYPVIQSMKEAAVLLDLDFAVRAANAAFCRLAGKQEGELVGLPVADAFPASRLPIAAIRNVLIQQGAGTYTCDLILDDSQKTYAGLIAVPVFDRMSRIAAIALLITDNSAIKEAEEKMAAGQAAIDQQNNLLIEDLKKANKMLESDLQQSKEGEMQWRRRVFENEALTNLSGALRTARTVQEMLSILLAETTRIFEASSGMILLKYTNTLVVKSLTGLPDDLRGFHHPVGEDALWKAFNTGNSNYVLDAAALPGNDLPPFLRSAMSIAIFPLKTVEKPLGLLVLGFDQKKYFNDFDQRLLAAIGTIASNALYRSNMIDSLEQRVVSRNRELETLFKITSIANEAREPKTVLDQAQKILLETLGSKLGIIYIHGKNDELHFAAQDEETLSEVQVDLKEISLENSIWGFIYHANQPLLVDSLDDDRRIDIKIVTELIALGNCALIGTPIRGSNETLGAICIFRDANQPYVMEDLALLGTVAHQLGIAIEIIALRKQDRLNTSRIERQRQGAELYDSISQLLSSTFLYAEAGGKLLQSGDAANLPANLEQIRQSSLQALKNIRVLIYQLRPASLESLGLYGAIQHRLDTVERRAHIDAALSGEYGFRLPGNMEEGLYQIVEEALNYSAQFSQATQVNIRLESDYNSISLELNDNGNGQTPTDAAKKTILANIRERVENLGGKFELSMQPGRGMHIKIKL